MAIINQCGTCNTDIKTYPSVNKKFCNNKCRNENYKTRRGKEASAYKGDKASYSAIHKWVYKYFGQPMECEQCGKTSKNYRHIQWANISGSYKRERSDWIRLCVWCHIERDKTSIQYQR